MLTSVPSWPEGCHLQGVSDAEFRSSQRVPQNLASGQQNFGLSLLSPADPCTTAAVEREHYNIVTTTRHGTDGRGNEGTEAPNWRAWKTGICAGS